MTETDSQTRTYTDTQITGQSQIVIMSQVMWALRSR